MAITIKDIPVNTGEVLIPGYNKQMWVVSSDKTGEANFNYIFDVYITGISSPSFFRFRLPAEPDNSYGVFDAHRIVENYIDSDIDKSTYGFKELANSYVQYTMKFGEEYGAATSGVTVYADLTTTVSYYAVNMSLDFIERQGYAQGDYSLLAPADKTFLTNAPQSGVIAYDEDAWLGMQVYESGHIDYVQIQSYDSDGVSQQIVKVNNDYKAFPNIESRFLSLSSGPNNLNLIDAGELTAGSQPIVATDTKRYYLQAFDSSDQRSSEQYWYTVDDQCTKHEVFRFHFLNELGRFDSFSFIRVSRRRSTVERRSYRKKTGSLSAAGLWVYSKSDRKKIQHHTVATDVITVNSDWIDSSTSDWLRELVESPEVYYDDGTDLIAVNILNTDYEKGRKENDIIFNLVLTFEWSYVRKRQRG